MIQEERGERASILPPLSIYNSDSKLYFWRDPKKIKGRRLINCFFASSFPIPLSSIHPMGNQVSKRKKKAVKKGDSTQPQEPRSSQASVMTTVESTQAAAVTLLECTMLGLSRQYVEQVQELHYLFKHVFQRNCMAPVDTLLTARGAQCLDIGCGPTATWIIGKGRGGRSFDGF
jgi:hypothetical protein